MSNELYNGFEWRLTMDEAPLPDGRIKKAVRVHRCDSVHIIAFTLSSTILLLREFRPFYGNFVWMLPGGRVDKENDPLTAAKRELREEAGVQAASIEFYCATSYSESFHFENHIYLAKDLSPAPLPQDADEQIEVHECTLSDAIQRVLSSPKVHTPSAFALLRYERDFPQ